MSGRTSLALAAVLALAAPAPALGASTVEVTAFGVEYIGDGNVNAVTFTDEAAPMSGTRVRISEPGVVALAMGGCVQNGANAAYCDISNSESVDAELDDGADVATVDGTRVDYRIDGDEGNDTITGGDSEVGAFEPFPVSDDLDGGPGQDTISGRRGDDSLDGGEGDGDVLEGGEGEDTLRLDYDAGAGDILRGGPGFDQVSEFYPDDSPLGATVDLAAGTVSTAGSASGTLESVEDARGSDGADTLYGTSGINRLTGAEGNDTLDGREGPDRLEGDAGDDTLEGRDGAADLLRGRTGADTCHADQLDTREYCEGGELVELPPFGSVSADRTAPTCRTRGLPRRLRAGKLRRGGLAFRVACDEAGRLDARLLGKLRRAAGGTRLARTGDVELALRSKRVGANETVRLRLRVGARLRRLIRRGARLRLQLQATDADGNLRTSTRRVRLR